MAYEVKAYSAAIMGLVVGYKQENIVMSTPTLVISQQKKNSRKHFYNIQRIYLLIFILGNNINKCSASNAHEATSEATASHFLCVQKNPNNS